MPIDKASYDIYLHMVQIELIERTGKTMPEILMIAQEIGFDPQEVFEMVGAGMLARQQPEKVAGRMVATFGIEWRRQKPVDFKGWFADVMQIITALARVGRKDLLPSDEMQWQALMHLARDSFLLGNHPGKFGALLMGKLHGVYMRMSERG